MSGHYARVVVVALAVITATASQNPMRDLIVATAVLALGAVTVELIRYWYDV